MSRNTPPPKSKYKGVEIRSLDPLSVRIVFQYKRSKCQEPITIGKTLKERELYAHRKREAVLFDMANGSFNYAKHFPESNSKFALAVSVQDYREPLIDDLLDDYIRIIDATLAYETRRNYKVKIRRHVRPRFGNLKPTQILPSQIKHWMLNDLVHYKSGADLANTTKNECLIPLREIFRTHKADLKSKYLPYAHVDLLIDALVELPEQDEDDEIDQFTVEELNAIENANTDREQEVNMLLFGCADGPRISELMGLGWEDIDTNTWEIKYRRALINGRYKITKTKRSKGGHKLLDRAVELLKRQMKWTRALPAVDIEVTQRDNKTTVAHSHRPVFVNSRTLRPYSSSQNYADRFYRTHLKRAGVRYRGPNQARHTFACKMLTAGMPAAWVAQRMRHTTEKMVRERYGDYIVEDMPGLIDLASERLDDLMAGASFEKHFKIGGKQDE